MAELTHIDEQGRARMVDVGEKPNTRRMARAEAHLTMAPETREKILAGAMPKGDVLAAARIAGILAAKRTHELIPLCHPIPLDQAEIAIAPEGEGGLRIEATARCRYHTGVEMEAMVAASIAALTIYDMCKAIDRGMAVSEVRLLEKSGGKSGHYLREE